MDDICLVQTVLDLTGFDVVDCLGDIHCDRSGLRVRHESLGTEHFTETSDDAHHIGSRNDDIEIQPSLFLDLGDQLFAADKVCSCSLRLVQLGSLCKYQYTNLLSGSVRENDCTTDLLIRMTGVTGSSDMNLNRLVKFRGCALFHQLTSLCGFVELCSVNPFGSFGIFLSVLHGVLLPLILLP